jgi:malate dehydrogenase (quinone)
LSVSKYLYTKLFHMADDKLRLETDVILIGAGIMSATLGVMLKELQPDIKIEIFERLDQAAAESSDAWNNAGTGHAAFCELNYTPQKEDGSVDISKALKIAESFEVTRQFWSYLIENNLIDHPENFIRKVPHLSFVWGKENVDYLKKRHEALVKYPLFKDMQFTTDAAVMDGWMPLVMEGRMSENDLAATKMDIGTDVNFGALTRSMFKYLESKEGVHLHFNCEVRSIKRNESNNWRLKIKNLTNNQKIRCVSPFAFIGAGGGSLLLLEKTGIPEAAGYGGFPVSGQWLKCSNPEVIEKHRVKVYGKASVGAPPMSVPHIDTRMINGKKELLFGPYAGFSTKFLKSGSYLDLFDSIQLSNVVPMLSAGAKNLSLTKYLIEQVFQSSKARMEALKEYVPSAKKKDWELEVAGQRVQVIKKDANGKGVLEFGTEVVTAADGSVAALLGASPGASTAVSIMIDLMNKCYKDKMKSTEWKEKLVKMIPSYGQKLNENPDLAEQIRKQTSEILKIN